MRGSSSLQEPTRSRTFGRCHRCGRTVRLTTQGKLFLHGDTVPVWKKDATTPDLGAHCPGGMTTAYDPGAARGPHAPALRAGEGAIP